MELLKQENQKLKTENEELKKNNNEMDSIISTNKMEFENLRDTMKNYSSKMKDINRAQDYDDLQNIINPNASTTED